MSKVKIIDKKSEDSILGERDLLSKLKHPFIINMLCAFQDYENLYLVLDFLSGGDLRYQFNSDHTFTENELKIFISCIILSLEYIHSNNVIHRDIKPENLVLDSKGYLHLTDFGVAKIINDVCITDTSGTPGYMAPEVIQGKNHSYPADFFAIGVVGYELIIGHRPYRGQNRKEIKKKMSPEEKEILIEEEDNKENKWSNHCINFINKCLRRNPEERIGYQYGIKELKEDIWFAQFDWKKLMDKNLKISFIPKDEKNFDQNYCEKNDKITDASFERYKEYMRKENYMKIFEGYTYYNNEVTVNTIENESITRVSTKTNKQDLILDNVITISKVNNTNTLLTPNIINYSNTNNSKKIISLNIKDKNEENKNNNNLLENKGNDYLQNKQTSLLNIFRKDKNIKKLLMKKQESYDTIDLNKKKIMDENNNKALEDKLKLNIINIKAINKEKSMNYNIYLPNNFKNKNEVSPIKIFNNNEKTLKDNKIQNKIDINIDIKNNMTNNNNNLKEINFLNFVKNTNSSINLMKNRNINIPRINFQKPIKKPLNIHNLSSREKKENEFNSKKDSTSIIKDMYSNNYLISSNLISKSLSKKNQMTNNGFILPDIRHFKFRITNKRKIKYMYINQNRIVENNHSCANNKVNNYRSLDKFIIKNPLMNKKYENITGETYQQIELYKNKNNNNNYNNKGKMLKSQSDIFPLLNNAY